MRQSIIFILMHAIREVMQNISLTHCQCPFPPPQMVPPQVYFGAILNFRFLSFVQRLSIMSILSRPRVFNSFILVLFRAESFKSFVTDEDSPSAISTPSSLNLLPRTIFVIAGSGFTPRGFGVEWSAYQRDTWDKVMP